MCDKVKINPLLDDTEFTDAATLINHCNNNGGAGFFTIDGVTYYITVYRGVEQVI